MVPSATFFSCRCSWSDMYIVEGIDCIDLLSVLTPGLYMVCRLCQRCHLLRSRRWTAMRPGRCLSMCQQPGTLPVIASCDAHSALIFPSSCFHVVLTCTMHVQTNRLGAAAAAGPDRLQRQCTHGWRPLAAAAYQHSGTPTSSAAFCEVRCQQQPL